MIGPPLDDNETTVSNLLVLLSAFAVATALLRESIAAKDTEQGAQAITVLFEALDATEAHIGPVNVMGGG